MNLALEYLIRNGRGYESLPIPYSLFLSNKETGNRLIISVHQARANPTDVMIKHWELWRDNKSLNLPPYHKFRIPRSEIKTSPLTIMPDYEILEFKEDNVDPTERQSAEPPRSLLQASEYKFFVDHFYCTKGHRIKRANWLWESFERTHVADDLLFKYGNNSPESKELQRDVVSYYSPATWKHWDTWKRRLDLCKSIAPEIVFAKEYGVEPKRENPRPSFYLGMYNPLSLSYTE